MGKTQKTAPPVLDWREDPELVAALSRAAALERDDRDRGAEASAAQTAAKRAARQLVDVEERHLIGRASDADLARARQEADATHRRAIEAKHAAADAQKELARLRGGTAQLEHEAQVRSIGAVRREYKDAVSRLADLLRQASEANEAVQRIYDAAERQWPSHVQGDDGRVLYGASAGLFNQAWPELSLKETNEFHHVFVATRLGDWLRECAEQELL